MTTAQKAGFDFEKYVAEKLKAQGFYHVKVTKASSDYGADILALKDGLEYVVQCKKYKGTVGYSALKDVSAAMDFYKADRGMLVCDTVFSKAVYKAKNKFDKPIDLIGLEELKEWKKFKSKSVKYRPFPYQQKILNCLIEHREKGNKAALLVLATGLGKTLVAAWDLKSQIKKGQKALFLVHRTDILVDNAEKFNFILNEKKGKFKFGVYFGGKKFRKEDIVFSTFQTMKRHYKKISKDYFDYIIIDEAHHSPAQTYANILSYFKPKFILGITATPLRAARKDNEFIESIFGKPLVDLGLAESLIRGYLSPVKFSVFSDNIDYAKLKTINKKLSVEQLNKQFFIPTKDEDIEKIIYGEMNKIDNPKTIVFCPTIKYINSVKSIGLFSDAEVYHSNMDDQKREIIFHRFKTGKIRTILVVDLFNEGIDIPGANLVVFLRTTYSPTIFFQQLGRGLRKASGKNYLRVLDFVGTVTKIKKVINAFGHLLIIQDFVEKVEKEKKLSNIHKGKIHKETGLLEPLELDFYQAGKRVKHNEKLYKKKSFLEEMAFLKKHLIKSDGWTEQEIIEGLTPICKRLGRFPSRKHLEEAKRFDLIVAIDRNGGPFYFSDKCGYPITYYTKRGSYAIWENIERDFNKIIKEIKHFPKETEFKKLGKYKLYAHAVKHYGSINTVREKMGYPIIRKHWAKEEVVAELKAFYDKQGHFITQEEARKSGKSGLYPKIYRFFGSVNEARRIIGCPIVRRIWTKKELIKEIKKIAKARIMPTSRELRKSGQQDLESAILKFGGFGVVAKMCGLKYGRFGKKGVLHKEANYWKKWANVKKEFKKASKEIKGRLTAKKLIKNGFGSLVSACFSYWGNLAKVKKKLGYK
ncbi:MAG: DEAD/DEAH box helicase family protein [Candidatus Diapherotrites archaeon]